MSKKTNNFQAEVQQILNLMIHSLYSNREVFLRELVSNASDAIDRLKFATLSDEKLKGKIKFEPEIRLTADEKAKTITISDNGIGMNEEEVVQNIGTIAHSGTKAWAEMAKKMQENPETIGQFGVGFYSAFMVADKVRLLTQKAGSEEAVIWESDAGGSTYTLDSGIRPEGHGTSITLHLKEFLDEEGNPDTSVEDFSNDNVLQSLVRKYSDFVAHPIKMKVEESRFEGEGDDKKEIKEVVDRTINTQVALWERPTTEIKEEEYKEFYKHLTHDWQDPQKWVHFKAEGMLEFSSLLFVPSQKPFNYDYQDYKHGLSLYVKRVFILSDCEKLIPTYLRFVRGMVDCSDLSLNVSREVLQQDRQVGRIQKSLTTKILSTLKEMLTKDREGYEKFWINFGATLKEGVMDFGNKDKIADLLIFHSTNSDQKTTLAEYVERMKPEQKAIYYVAGENMAQLEKSPYLEQLRSKGYEVLFLVDRVDEWVAGQMPKFKDHDLKSVMSDDLDLDTEEEKKAKEEESKQHEEKLKPIMESMKKLLEADIKDVKISHRLTDSAVCLVNSANAPSAQMERMMKSMGQDLPKNKRVLEINPKHPVFGKMLELEETKRSDWAKILYSQALLNEGSNLENPLEYSKKITEILVESATK